MSQKSQKDAVVEAVKKTLGSSYDPAVPVSTLLTKEQKKEMAEQIIKQIMDGDVAYSKDITDEEAVKKYVPGMISNHIRKAKELNGGTYTTQASGRGHRDQKLSTLNRLRDTYEEDSEEYNTITEAIIERQSELAEQKMKASKRQLIDISLLPEDLHDLALHL